jgi:hypothetical protein
MRYNKGDKVKMKNINAIRNYINMIGGTVKDEAHGVSLRTSDKSLQWYINDRMLERKSTSMSIKIVDDGFYICSDNFSYADWMLE